MNLNLTFDHCTQEDVADLAETFTTVLVTSDAPGRFTVKAGPGKFDSLTQRQRLCLQANHLRAITQQEERDGGD